ncbi:MAG TPA: prepilin-type N-terminal cleavage/methylation domain-containing protein [Casimicrobiaceae bacterium]|nr:prepilin-type N-terminal cleavage/methylation domain-containing protein [Casimicrobiaceae bacterium]
MPARSRAGYTLIEVLAVIAVIAIASGLVAVNLEGDDRKGVEREASRLAGALEHAAALAQWRSETLGFSADGPGYRFWRRGADNRWTAVRDEEVLAARTLPAQWSVSSISYSGAPVAGNVIVPFRPSGRNEPYVLALSSPAWTFVVAGDPLNRVQVAAPTASR